jgi:hypothetical protein
MAAIDPAPLVWTVCPRCQTNIGAPLENAGEFVRCGNCGTAAQLPAVRPKAPALRRQFLQAAAIVAGVAVLCLTIGIVVAPREHAAPRGPVEAPLPDPIRVAARDLVAAYNDNAIAAEQRFGKQIVLVTGRVAKIDRDILGDPYVLLADAGEAWGVQCMFAAADELAALKVGQVVAVLGVCDGKLLNLFVRNARLIK